MFRTKQGKWEVSEKPLTDNQLAQVHRMLSEFYLNISIDGWRIPDCSVLSGLHAEAAGKLDQITPKIHWSEVFDARGITNDRDRGEAAKRNGFRYWADRKDVDHFGVYCDGALVCTVDKLEGRPES